MSSCGPGTGANESVTSVESTESASIEDVEDSDGEVSKIDFRGVNLRTKKKRDGQDDNSSSDNVQQQPERPMSWEGELSDQEMSSNTITNHVIIVRHFISNYFNVFCDVSIVIVFFSFVLFCTGFGRNVNGRCSDLQCKSRAAGPEISNQARARLSFESESDDR